MNEGKHRGVYHVLAIAIKPLAATWFWLLRWYTHHQFLLWLANEKIGRPSLLARPLNWFGKLCRLLARNWQYAYANYALEHYHAFLQRHYAPDGIGYFNYDNLTDGERRAIFSELDGRIAHYLEHNGTVLDFANGHSFLDAGCGKGQNVKELVRRYPNSPVRGFDVNEGALGIVRSALGESPLLQIEVGSLSDEEYLQSFPDNSVDHVIVSHVFSFLAGPTLEKTKALRQGIVDQLVRISDKTVVIMDSHIGPDADFEVVLEQNTRCFFRESLAAYFAPHIGRGEMYYMISPQDQAIVLKIKKTNP